MGNGETFTGACKKFATIRNDRRKTIGDVNTFGNCVFDTSIARQLRYLAHGNWNALNERKFFRADFIQPASAHVSSSHDDKTHLSLSVKRFLVNDR